MIDVEIDDACRKSRFTVGKMFRTITEKTGTDLMMVHLRTKFYRNKKEMKLQSTLPVQIFFLKFNSKNEANQVMEY